MAAGLLVKIVVELIFARIERPDENSNFSARGHNLFAVEFDALEFRGGRVLVAHNQYDLDPGGDLNLAWHELIVLQRDRETGIVGEGGSRGESEQSCYPGDTAHGGLREELQMRTLRSITESRLRINLIIPVRFATEVCAARITSNSQGSN